MEVVVVGSCMRDLVSYTPRLPKPGETLTGHKFTVGYGGKGANQCVVSSRLGAKAAMIGKVGDDDFGHGYIQNFKDNKVNIDYMGISKEAATGVATISVNDNGQNAIIIIPGANLQLCEADVCEAEGLLSGAEVLLCQLETSPQVSLAAMKAARKHNVTTVLNPAPALADLDPEMYTVCDIFCPNETEAEILTGQPVTSVQDAHRALEVLLDRGCKTVIITLGAMGSVYATQGDRTPVHVPATQVNPVDSTGAGDAFVGALAYYLACMPQLSFTEVIRRSGEIATKSVLLPGTQTSYSWHRDLPPEFFQT